MDEWQKRSGEAVANRPLPSLPSASTNRPKKPASSSSALKPISPAQPAARRSLRYMQRSSEKEGRKEGRKGEDEPRRLGEGGREGAREAECFMVSDEASQPASSELLPILSLPAPVASIRPSRPSVSQSTLSLIFPN